jgi:threonine dehydratase
MVKDVAMVETDGLPDIAAIEQARERLAPILARTPILPLDPPPLGDGSVLLKCENLQRTGSFKIRGAYNRIAGLSPAQRAAGVVAYSSGNHAQGVACAAALLGVPATVVMPEGAVEAKVAATRAYGAEVLFAGTDSETRRRVAEALARERGAALVPPYDHPAVIAGQATIGLEMLDAVPDVETVLAPIGGGGLISGIALAIKARRPETRVIGVEPEGAADARASLRAGHIVERERVDTIADGLRARRIGALPFQAISAAVDEIVTVTDAAIVETMRRLLVRNHLVVEPSGAVAVAAALAGAARGKSVALVSGGNIARELLVSLVDRAR